MTTAMAKGMSSRFLREVATPYPNEAKEFTDYLERLGEGLTKNAIESYLGSIEQKKRVDTKGRSVSFSPSWFNQRVKAVKGVVRQALERAPELSNGERYAIERFLQSIKLKKVKTGIGKVDRVPEAEEVARLVESADPRLSLIIEFLAETGARISEALAAELGKVRRGARVTYIAITGKGGKERDLRCRSELYDRILKTFRGNRYLFEHDASPYSRVATTNRIRNLSEKAIGKPVTAHMLRHFRGTQLSEKLGISKAASELGHADIRTTKRFYDHSAVSEDEFLSTL